MRLLGIDVPGNFAILIAGMSKKLRNLFFIAAFVLAFGSVIFSVTRPRPRLPLPSPNGYDDFLNASRLITGDVYAATTNTHGAFGEFLGANAEPLRLAHLGLTHDCRVPVDPSFTNFSALLNDLASQKRLALLLTAEGQFAEQENRAADAVQSYLAVIRYGDKIGRGGFVINRLVGLACESMGYDRLLKLISKLNCEQVRPSIAVLENIETNGVTWDEVLHGENTRAWNAELHQSLNPIRWVMDWRSTRAAIKKGEEKHNRMNARLRLFTVELALRCHQSEQGRPPERLEQLVPKYLQRVPEDPFGSHQPLHYRSTGTNWLLYSVGIDRVDDGGKPVSRSISGSVQKGDMFYDSPY